MKVKEIIKQNWKLAAEIKTIADYALILEHCNGYDKKDCIRLAGESAGETLFELLRERNEELFKTGSIAMIDAQRSGR